MATLTRHLHPLRACVYVCVFVQTFKAEGFPGLYKGVASPLVGMGIFNAVQFAVFTSFRSAWTNGGRSDTVANITGAAVCTGAVVALIEGPQDLIKSQMQKQIAAASDAQARGLPAPKAEFSSTLDCAKQIVARRGVQGLLQGFVPTVYRNMVGVGAYFACYEAARRAMTNNYARPPSSLEVLAAGGCGGFFYWLLCFPLDVIKTRVQTDALDPTQRRFRGMVDATRGILAEDGARGFMRGIAPALARSVPANAVGFALYEQAKAMMLTR